jgi:hypothetical protein
MSRELLEEDLGKGKSEREAETERDWGQESKLKWSQWRLMASNGRGRIK